MSVSLSTLGGPSSVTVDVDKGIFGIPGTQFYLSNGDPNVPTNLPGVVPRRYDFVINLDPQDADYLVLYQYNFIPGTQVLAWLPGFKLVQNTVARNEAATFDMGVALIQFDIALPTGYSSGTGGIPENYDIQFEISNEPGSVLQSPVSASYLITGLVVNNGIATVSMAFTAVEFASNLWVPLAGNKVIHLIITVV